MSACVWQAIVCTTKKKTAAVKRNIVNIRGSRPANCRASIHTSRERRRHGGVFKFRVERGTVSNYSEPIPSWVRAKTADGYQLYRLDESSGCVCRAYTGPPSRHRVRFVAAVWSSCATVRQTTNRNPRSRLLVLFRRRPHATYNNLYARVSINQQNVINFLPYVNGELQTAW